MFLDESSMSEARNIDRIVLFGVPGYKDPGQGLFQRRGTPIVHNPISIRLRRSGGGRRLDEFVSSGAVAGRNERQTEVGRELPERRRSWWNRGIWAFIFPSI
jgi:hypothetical protein